MPELQRSICVVLYIGFNIHATDKSFSKVGWLVDLGFRAAFKIISAHIAACQFMAGGNLQALAGTDQPRMISDTLCRVQGWLPA